MVSGTEQQPELRLFRPGDLGAVQAVIFRTIDACYAEVYPPQALAFFKEFHSKENILEDSGQGHTFVLEVDGRIVGAGGLSKATIKRVFVDPEFQHRGLGRLMMARLEEQARERGVTTVDLDASLPSKRFYDFLGYQGDELARIPVGSGRFLDYYPMTKTLG